MASSRAAWPHALHRKQQQQQQRKKSRRDQVWAFRQPVLFLIRQHRGAGGTGLVVIGGIFVGMDDEFVFTMDTPVDRNYFFGRIIRGLLFAIRVDKPCIVGNICGQGGETLNSRNFVSSKISSGWYA